VVDYWTKVDSEIGQRISQGISDEGGSSNGAGAHM